MLAHVLTVVSKITGAQIASYDKDRCAKYCFRKGGQVGSFQTKAKTSSRILSPPKVSLAQDALIKASILSVEHGPGQRGGDSPSTATELGDLWPGGVGHLSPSVRTRLLFKVTERQNSEVGPKST